MTDTTWLSIIGMTGVLVVMLDAVLYATSPRPVRHEFKLLGILLFVVSLSEAIGFVGGFLLRKNMNPMYSAFNFFVATLWFQFYRERFKHRVLRLAVNIGNLLFVAFAVVNFLSLQGPAAINSNSFAALGVAKLVLSLIYFYLLIQELPEESATSIPMFWINSAVLIGSAGTMLVNFTTTHLVNVLNDFMEAFMFHNFVLFIHYALIAAGLWLARKKHRLHVRF